MAFENAGLPAHGKHACIQGWKAYNITPDPKWGIGAWSDAQLQGYLAHARRLSLRSPASLGEFSWPSRYSGLVGSLVGLAATKGVFVTTSLWEDKVTPGVKARLYAYSY